MKLIISFFMFFIMGCSNSYKTPKIVENNYQQLEVPQVGMGRTVNIVSFTSSYENEKSLEETFGKSLLTIAQNEFSNSGFTVVERYDFNDTVKEHIFSKEVATHSLSNNFVPARYNVYIKIVNMQVSSGGTWIPILYTNTDFYIETSLEIKMVNNETGTSHTKNGKAIISKKEKNTLLFFGDLGVNINNAVEYSLRNALKDGISKFQ